MITERVLKNLSDLMEERGVSMADIARGINITQPSVSNWWRKNTCPTIPMIEKLGSWFGVDPAYFYLENPKGLTEAKPIERDDDFKAFMDELAMKYLDEHDQEAYHFHGGASKFLQVMRSNFETDSIGLSDWYLKLSKKVKEYAGLDLMEKTRNRIKNSIPDKKSESA